MSVVQEMAARALARDPATPLIEHEHRWITVGEVAATAAAVNALIDASGADARAPVALIPRNRPGMLAALMGLVLRERHIRMIHPYQSPEGLARDVERLKPAVVVATAPDFEPLLVGALQARGVAGVALDGMAAQVAPGCERSLAECDPPPPEPQIDLLTSGTTGRPKQFPLTYEFIGREMVINSPIAVPDGVDPLSLAPWHLFWPFGNFSGLYSTLTPMLHGMRGVLADRFSVEACRDFIRRFQPERIGIPPAGVQMLLDAGIPREELACLKFVSVGSAPLPLASHRAFHERYGIPILEAYGATEFGGPVTMMTPDLYAEWGVKKLGSVGRSYRGAQLRAVDPETGEVLPAGTEGLLEVIAPRMGEHWIRTSDLGVVDEDGFVWHRGRADGAIMRGGFKLLPETIEEALVKHEAVAAAMATGIPDRRLGQVPAVGMRLKPGARRPSLEELEQHLRRHVEATHIPVAWRFVESLPYTAMMKPDRLALRALFETAAVD
jgi:acyl-coenzyme A synthetase/AMP-(fatty) acid ligase